MGAPTGMRRITPVELPRSATLVVHVRFIEPMRSDRTWPGLEIRPVAGKGLGVVATVKIAAGLLIPYIGKTSVYITHSKYQLYLPTADGSIRIVDAPPIANGDGTVTQNPLYIAACANEASNGERYNCAFVYVRATVRSTMTSYPQIRVGPRHFAAFLMTIRDVEPGAELLVPYGDEYGDEADNGYTAAAEDDDYSADVNQASRAAHLELDFADFGRAHTILKSELLSEFRRNNRPVDVRFIAAPVNGVWPDIEVRPVAGKGSGLVARVDIPAGLLIPYIGKVLVGRAQRRASKSRYLLEIPSTTETRMCVDADPATYGFLTIAGRANEASQDELYNCAFVYVRDSARVKMPRYDHFTADERQFGAFLMTVRPVAAGTELLVPYGEEYHAEGSAYKPAPFDTMFRLISYNAQLSAMIKLGDDFAVDHYTADMIANTEDEVMEESA